MDYGLGFALALKCIFVMIPSQYFYRDSIYDTWWKKKMDKTILQQNILPTNNYGLLNDQI
jgi:hypothetical protein